MKKENVIIQKNIYYHLALEGEGGTKCRVREGTIRLHAH